MFTGKTPVRPINFGENRISEFEYNYLSLR